MAVDPRRSRFNRLRGAAPAEPIEEKKVVEIDFSKSDQRTEYIKTKLDDILDKIGQSYGKKMVEELMKRLDQTIADFHSEVIQVLSKLEGLDEERKKAAVAALQPKEEEAITGEETAESAEMSDFEKRLEKMEKEKEQKKQASKTEEEVEKPKKKGLFRRK